MSGTAYDPRGVDFDQHRIEQLEAELERLREALAEIAGYTIGFGCLGQPSEEAQIAHAALESRDQGRGYSPGPNEAGEAE